MGMIFVRNENGSHNPPGAVMAGRLAETVG
jgi:hypothetical protein